MGKKKSQRIPPPEPGPNAASAATATKPSLSERRQFFSSPTALKTEASPSLTDCASNGALNLLNSNGAPTDCDAATAPLEQSPTPHTEDKLKDLFHLQAANAGLLAENSSLRLEMDSMKTQAADRERQHERALARASRRSSSSAPVDLHDVELSRRCNELLASLGEVCDGSETPFRITFGRTANALEAHLASYRAQASVLRATEAAVTEFHALERSARATLDEKQAAFESQIREVSRVEAVAAKAREAACVPPAASQAASSLAGPTSSRLLADLLSKYSAKMLMLEHYAGVQSRLLSTMQKKGSKDQQGGSSDEEDIESGQLESDSPPSRAESPPAAPIITSSWGIFM